MTIWRMRIACWITKATDTHSENVILIAFPLQQWLCERVSTLRYTYTACLFFLCARWHKLRNAPVSRVVSVHPSVHLLVSPHVSAPTPAVMFTYFPKVHDYHSPHAGDTSLYSLNQTPPPNSQPNPTQPNLT